LPRRGAVDAKDTGKCTEKAAQPGAGFSGLRKNNPPLGAAGGGNYRVFRRPGQILRGQLPKKQGGPPPLYGPTTPVAGVELFLTIQFLAGGDRGKKRGRGSVGHIAAGGIFMFFCWVGQLLLAAAMPPKTWRGQSGGHPTWAGRWWWQQPRATPHTTKPITGFSPACVGGAPIPWGLLPGL